MVIAIHVWLVLLVVQCAVAMAAETAKPLWWTLRNAMTTPSMGYLSSIIVQPNPGVLWKAAGWYHIDSTIGGKTFVEIVNHAPQLSTAHCFFVGAESCMQIKPVFTYVFIEMHVNIVITAFIGSLQNASPNKFWLTLAWCVVHCPGIIHCCGDTWSPWMGANVCWAMHCGGQSSTVCLVRPTGSAYGLCFDNWKHGSLNQAKHPRSNLWHFISRWGTVWCHNVDIGTLVSRLTTRS